MRYLPLKPLTPLIGKGREVGNTRLPLANPTVYNAVYIYIIGIRGEKVRKSLPPYLP